MQQMLREKPPLSDAACVWSYVGDEQGSHIIELQGMISGTEE